MKAMVFAAGLGTRLRPLTDSMPKALVPVGGVPMLQRVILNLKACGFTEIVVNIHHFGQQIVDFLNENGNFGVDVHISDERGELLDTGGGILKAHGFLDGSEPFLVHNADVLTDIDLSEFYQYHLHHNADATLLVAGRVTSRYLLLDGSNRLHGWINTKTGEVKPEGFAYKKGMWQKMAFGGIHVISPSVFPFLRSYTQEHKFSIVPFYLDNCQRLNIMGYAPRQEYAWFDIGKPDTLVSAEKWLSSQS